MLEYLIVKKIITGKNLSIYIYLSICLSLSLSVCLYIQ
jgi:hypothetical protein